MRYARFLTFCFVTMVLGGCTSAFVDVQSFTWNSNNAAQTASTSAPAQLAGPVDGQFLALTNQYRASKGLPALKLDQRLTNASQDMAQIIAAAGTPKVRQHSRRGLINRLKENGFENVPAAENLLMGEHNTRDAFDAWVNSRGHRANLLNTSVTHLGAARVDRGGRAYWAMILAGPPFTPRPFKLELPQHKNGRSAPPPDER